MYLTYFIVYVRKVRKGWLLHERSGTLSPAVENAVKAMKPSAKWKQIKKKQTGWEIVSQIKVDEKYWPWIWFRWRRVFLLSSCVAVRQYKAHRKVGTMCKVQKSRSMKFVCPMLAFQYAMNETESEWQATLCTEMVILDRIGFGNDVNVLGLIRPVQQSFVINICLLVVTDAAILLASFWGVSSSNLYVRPFHSNIVSDRFLIVT